jgi:hypothetical protein
MIVVLAWFFAMLLFLLLFSYSFSLFADVVIVRKPFDQRKVVYRIVKGKSQQLEKEEDVYIRRARSLWGKAMSQWDIFRITFPCDATSAVFGIIVPDTFDIDKDCLQELGFSLGFLDGVTDCAIVEFPRRIGAIEFWNHYRVRSGFSHYSRTNSKSLHDVPFAMIRDGRNRKMTYVRPLGDCRGLWLPAQSAN